MNTLEELIDQLNGPMGEALRVSGETLERRLKAAGLSWADLDNRQIAEAFIDAFREIAPKAYPHMAPELLDQAIEKLAADIYMALAATADGSCAIN